MDTTLHIPSSLGAEKAVLVELEKVLALAGCRENERLDLQTAVAEACLNAIEHGNRFNPGLTIDIHIRATGNRITVEVYDQGRGAELNAQVRQDDCSSPISRGSVPSAEECRGWGLFFVAHLVDHWDYRYLPEQGRFCMRLTKQITEAGEDA